jgi:nitrite reductase [NAD(P)H] large subunit
VSEVREKLVVVGNGMAGLRTVEELLKRAPDRYDITIFGAEPHPNYNRILLSAVLAGEAETGEIVINPREWYDAHGITLFTSDPVVALDPAARLVTAASGRRVAYDKLLLATGSRPLAPPIPGLDLKGVSAFRDIGDVETMIAATRHAKRAVVIGGGLLGLEAAWGLNQRGMDVTIIHLMPTLMERQLDAAAGQFLQRDLEGRGIAFITEGVTEEVVGTGHIEAVHLADGRAIPADLVVLAIGIRPEIALARQAGLDANRGIVVGDDMRSTDPHIYAVGECAEHRGLCFGLVEPLWSMASVCAARLAGSETALFATPVLATRLKITGIDVFSAGVLMAEAESDDEITLQDSLRGVYKKLVLREGRIVGAVLYGDIADSARYLALIADAIDIAPFRQRIIFDASAATTRTDTVVAPIPTATAANTVPEIGTRVGRAEPMIRAAYG